MFRNTQRTNAVNTFYLAGALMVSSLALPTLAAEDAEMEEVVVTGSRIARPDLIGNSPIKAVFQHSSLLRTTGMTQVIGSAYTSK